MKREQIIEILERFITESEDYPDCILSYNFSRVADAILALPLDVPTDQEIKDEIFANNPVLDGDPEWIYGFRQGQFSGAKMMRNEIIKRNRVI